MKQYKNNPILLIVAVSIGATVLLSLLLYKQLALLHFINISFYISSVCIGFGLLLMIASNGFFDGITHGFRTLFRRNHRERGFEDDSRVVPLSELITLPHSPLLYSGVILLFINIVCLFFYYQ
ncbi:MAG: DUF3899 domain-containing protein [Bacillus sp. (in: firmicutes)]